MTELGRRTIQISIAIGAIVGLIGCGEEASNVEAPSHDFGISSFNGLTSLNGLTSINGLTSLNGLTSINGLTSFNGLMTTSGGRKTVTYLVKCALAASDSLVKQDQYGSNYTFAGGLGLCPAWKNGAVYGNDTCMEAISACMMAHINTSGVHVPLWLDSNDPTIGWGVDRVNYPMQEGTFFGDIIDTGLLTNLSKPGVTAPVAYYCDGAGFPAGANGIVAGRIGANQGGAPYMNPFGSGTLCQSASNGSAVGQFSLGVSGSCPSGSNSNPAAGCPDGYKAITTYSNGGVWQHGITVWRNNNYTPVFDGSFVYRLAPLTANGYESMDVPYGSTNDGTVIQQYASWNGSPQMFNLFPDGAYWHIAMNANNAKCIDLSGGGSSLGNGTQLMVNDCKSGDPSQDWMVTPDAQSGAFIFKNVQSGRCMDEPGWNTASGVLMDTWDCNGGTNQKFLVQAFPMS